MTLATAPAPGPPLAPAFSHGRERHGTAPAVMAALTVCLLPFLVPAGPGNSALADVGIAGCIIASLLWVAYERLPMAVPYIAGVSLMVLGGALAAALSQAPVTVSIVLAQDVFLLLWAAALALGRHDPWIIEASTHAWCRVVPVYAAVMALAYVVGLTSLAGVTERDGARASYTFGDPNLAGNFLVVSLFVMAACQRPRSSGVRRAGYVAVVVAIVFTGSNGAMLTLAAGVAVATALSQLRRRGPWVAALWLCVCVALAGGSALALRHVDDDALRENAAGGVPLVRDSFGRTSGSADSRMTLADESLGVFLDGRATGLGPSRTKATLEAEQAPYTKEAHNDYLATLLERGVIGAFGLVLLVCAILSRCVRLATGPVPERLARAVPRPWLLAAVAPVMLGAALFYEVLHFRHLWAWLGIVAAITLAQHDERVAGRR